MRKLYQQWIGLCVIAGFMSACTNVKINTAQSIHLSSSTHLVVGPIANYSDTPLANKQVETMLSGIMHAKGFHNVRIFPKKQACAKLLYCPEDTPSRAEVIKWARLNGVQFIMMGSANEWRYKVGLDGEPVAGVSFIIVDVRNAKTIWSGVGSIIGSSRQGLDVVGQQLLQETTLNVVPVN